MLALNGHGQGVGMYPSSEVVIDIYLNLTPFNRHCLCLNIGVKPNHVRISFPVALVRDEHWLAALEDFG